MKMTSTLQNDLNKLFDWEIASNIAFNLKKFVWVQYGRSYDLKESYNYFSKDYDHISTKSQSTRDLGIMIKSDANYSDHFPVIREYPWFWG